HEEEAQLVILMLVGVKNVGAALVKQAGDAGDESLAVGAVDQENCGVFHPDSSLQRGTMQTILTAGAQAAVSLPATSGALSFWRRFPARSATIRSLSATVAGTSLPLSASCE